MPSSFKAELSGLTLIGETREAEQMKMLIWGGSSDRSNGRWSSRSPLLRFLQIAWASTNAISLQITQRRLKCAVFSSHFKHVERSDEILKVKCSEMLRWRQNIEFYLKVFITKKKADALKHSSGLFTWRTLNNRLWLFRSRQLYSLYLCCPDSGGKLGTAVALNRNPHTGLFTCLRP